MFVIFLFGHCNVCHFWPKRKRTNITMTKEKKDKHCNGQREKGQTLQ
jgi:hypothetical protein